MKLRLPKLYVELPVSDHDEIHRYTSDIAHLTKLREKAMQLAVLKSSDAQQQKYLEEVDRYTTQIEIAQKVQQQLIEKQIDGVKQ